MILDSCFGVLDSCFGRYGLPIYTTPQDGSRLSYFGSRYPTGLTVNTTPQDGSGLSCDQKLTDQLLTDVQDSRIGRYDSWAATLSGYATGLRLPAYGSRPTGYPTGLAPRPVTAGRLRIGLAAMLGPFLRYRPTATGLRLRYDLGNTVERVLRPAGRCLPADRATGLRLTVERLADSSVHTGGLRPRTILRPAGRCLPADRLAFYRQALKPLIADSSVHTGGLSTKTSRPILRPAGRCLRADRFTGQRKTAGRLVPYRTIPIGLMPSAPRTILRPAGRCLRADRSTGLRKNYPADRAIQRPHRRSNAQDLKTYPKASRPLPTGRSFYKIKVDLNDVRGFCDQHRPSKALGRATGYRPTFGQLLTEARLLIDRGRQFAVGQILTDARSINDQAIGQELTTSTVKLRLLIDRSTVKVRSKFDRCYVNIRRDFADFRLPPHHSWIPNNRSPSNPQLAFF